MDNIPVAFLICVDGVAFFEAQKLINWDHADGIYGWSALKPNMPHAHPVMLEGDHFAPYSTPGNISAISTSIAIGIDRARSAIRENEGESTNITDWEGGLGSG